MPCAEYLAATATKKNIKLLLYTIPSALQRNATRSQRILATLPQSAIAVRDTVPILTATGLCVSRPGHGNLATERHFSETI